MISLKNTDKLEEYILKISLYILPLALIFSIALVNLITAFFSLFFIVKFYYSSKLKLFVKNKLIIYLLLFNLYLIIISFFSHNIQISLLTSLFYLRFIFTSLVIGYILITYKNAIVGFAYSLWFFITLVVLDGYVQYFSGINIFGWPQLDPVRVSGFFKEELILGSYLSRLFPLAIFFIFYINESIKKSHILFYLSLILLVLIDILVYLAGERVALFYMLLSTICIIIFINRLRFLRILSLLISIFIIFSINVYQPEVKSRMIDFTIEQISKDSNDGSKKLNAFSTKHESHYKIALQMFKEKPFIGYGPKMFRYVCEKDIYDQEGCSTHPHNTYMQLLAETGIIGAIFIILLLLYISYIFIIQFFNKFIFTSKKNYKDYEIILYIAFLLSLWPLVPTGNFFTTWLNTIYFLPLGIHLFIQSR